ncbi:MAG TPA: tetratricopeptide repeat protein [Phycisphaerae bacterium]|nr:tetratricopeptide repeat protein [Phycisphaerae bacterium]
MFAKHDRKSHSPAHAAALYQQGLEAFETGRYAEAIEKLAAIGEGPNLPATLARYYLGQARLQQGLIDLAGRRYAEAAAHLAEARRVNPESNDLSSYLARCYLGQGRFDLAVVEMERSYADGDRETWLPVRLAHALARDGQFARAVETLEAAIRTAPYQAEYHYQLGVLHASADDYAAALKSLTEAVRLAPLRSDIHRQLGLVHGALNDADRAVRYLATAQRLRPRDANTAMLLALAIQAAGGPFEDVAIAPAPDRTAADTEGLEQLGEVLVADPDFVEAFLSLPSANIDPALFTMLAATIEKALERHPTYADLHYHCSRVYDRLGRTDAAIAQAVRAVRINPRYVQALIQLGRLYSQTSRDEEAIDRLQAAIESGGDYPDVHYLLGELHRRRGERELACARYRRALEINTNYTRAQEALDAVLTA